MICQENDMRAHLLFGDRDYPIPSGDLIRIGSHEACDVQIAGDCFVSRRHCSLSFVDEQLSIVDLDSTHGTLVNGEEIGKQPVVLSDGDRISVGQSQLVVHLHEGPAG